MRVGKYINLGMKIAGAFLVASPAIKGAVDHRGDPQNIPAFILYNYTGVDAGGNINFSQTTAGVAAVLGGILLSKLGGIVGRSF